jgi:hypothetical protein
VEKAPLLEALFGYRGLGPSKALMYPEHGDVACETLVRWIPKLTKLQELKLFEGTPLLDENLPQLVSACCPQFRKLGFFFW